jgi:hypothetical protein
MGAVHAFSAILQHIQELQEIAEQQCQPQPNLELSFRKLEVVAQCNLSFSAIGRLAPASVAEVQEVILGLKVGQSVIFVGGQPAQGADLLWTGYQHSLLLHGDPYVACCLCGFAGATAAGTRLHG